MRKRYSRSYTVLSFLTMFSYRELPSGFAFFDGGKTGCLGNILWFLFGGLFLGLGWCVTEVLWRLTLIGIPVGVQCFKLAKLSLMPFGAEIIGG